MRPLCVGFFLSLSLFLSPLFSSSFEIEIRGGNEDARRLRGEYPPSSIYVYKK